jgi:uroporphyrinogen-III synthase
LLSGTDKSLKDKIIISTRALEPGDSLPDLLKVCGAKLISLPMIEIAPSQLDTQMTEQLIHLEKVDWIFFTSKNGVINFFKHLIGVKGNTELPKTVKLAVIGYKTGLELEYYGYTPTFISDENTSDQLLNQFYKAYNPTNLTILLCVGNLADNTLSNRLSRQNKVERINVYQTVKPTYADPETIKIIKDDQYDLIIFTSASTFTNFCTFFSPDQIGRLKLASIGTTTTRSIQEAGFEPVLTAKKSSAEGLRDAIIEYYQL